MTDEDERVSDRKVVVFTYAIVDETGAVREQSDLPLSYIHGVSGRMYEKVEQALEAGAALLDNVEDHDDRPKLIGKAASLGHLLARQVAPRQRHAKAIARRARDVGAPRDLYLRVVRNRPGRAGQCLLEFIERGFFSHSVSK